MKLEHPRLRSELGPVNDVPFGGEVNGLIKFRLSHGTPQPTRAEKRPFRSYKNTRVLGTLEPAPHMVFHTSLQTLGGI